MFVFLSLYVLMSILLLSILICAAASLVWSRLLQYSVPRPLVGVLLDPDMLSTRTNVVSADPNHLLGHIYMSMLLAT